jgi:hypothetical protein
VRTNRHKEVIIHLRKPMNYYDVDHAGMSEASLIYAFTLEFSN